MKKPDFTGVVAAPIGKRPPKLELKKGVCTDRYEFMRELDNLVKSLSYKPDTEFSFHREMTIDGPVAGHIRICMKRDCSVRRQAVREYVPNPSWFDEYQMNNVVFGSEERMVKPHVTLWSGLRIDLDFMYIENWRGMVVDMLYGKIIEMEMHEVKEWFQVGGEHYEKPHGENGEFL